MGETKDDREKHSIRVLAQEDPGLILLYEVDGCQYVVAYAKWGVAITHKANCPNHRSGSTGD